LNKLAKEFGKEVSQFSLVALYFLK
jgi:hypothetical protein